MSIPNPISVSPSTTVVQVNPLESPYTPVFLSTIAFPGQVATILDATSSFGVLTTPIVLSTGSFNSFADGSRSTLIDQPQGFVTVQSYSTNTWTILNSFPFRNQAISAGLLTLTASTVFTAEASTVYDTVSSLVVDTLRVTGPYIQTEGFQLNTSVSSIGSASFFSSLQVWGPVYLSSSLVANDSVTLTSSLTVNGPFSTESPLFLESSLSIAGSLLAIGPLSTSILNLRGTLVGPSLEVQQSSLTSTEVATSLSVISTLSSLSSFYTGGYLETRTLSVDGTAVWQSSVSLNQSFQISSNCSISQDVLVVGQLGVGGLLSVYWDLMVQSTIVVGTSATFRDNLSIGTSFITSSLRANRLESAGDYANLSTVAQLSSILAETDVGVGYVSSASTLIGDSLTIASTLKVGQFLQVTGQAVVQEGISSLQTLSVGQDVLSLGGLSSLANLTSRTLSTLGYLTVEQSTILNQATYISASVSTVGNLFCDGTLTISSITLPSSLQVFNFTTESMAVGTIGIVPKAFINTLYTSSVTFGAIDETDYSFDLSGSLTLTNSASISTSLLSSASCLIGDSLTSYVRVTGGMGVGIEAPVSSLHVQPLAYFTSTLRVYSTLSTGAIYAPSITGRLVGDGSLLTNVAYPVSISAQTLFVQYSTLTDGTISLYNTQQAAGYLQASTLTTSSLLFQNARAFLYSTMTVDSLTMSGIDAPLSYTTGTNLLQVEGQTLAFNTVKFVNQGINSKRVAINEDLQGTSFTAALGVYSTLAVNAITSPYTFNLARFRANQIEASNVSGTNESNTLTAPYTGSVSLSSGTILTQGGPFFLGAGASYSRRYNTVQPFRSTLQFNSTLIVNRGLSSVGIRTLPNFNLDVPTVRVEITTVAGISSQIANSIRIQPSLSTLFYAFTGISTFYSATASSWSNYSLTSFATSPYFVSLLSPGLPVSEPSVSNAAGPLFYEKTLPQWFLGSEVKNGAPSGQLYRREYFGSLETLVPATFDLSPPNTFYSMATNGPTLIATGIIDPGYQGVLTKTLFYSAPQTLSNTFTAVSSSLFPAFSPPISHPVGGYSIVYGGVNAPVWIVAGVGAAGPLYRSTDNGASWTVISLGLYEFRSIVVTELPSNGGTVVLVCGGVLTSTGSSYILTQGVVFASLDAGVTWTSVGSGGLASDTRVVTAIATDGLKIVATVQSLNPSSGATLYYSYLTSSNTYSWTLCEGTLFPTTATSILYTGSQWLAGGDTGVRQSSNGITWVSSGSPSQPVLQVGYMSNAAPMITVGDSNQNQLLYFQEAPSLQCQRLLSVPTISYYPSSILHLNNACILDSQQNCIVPGAVNAISPLALTGFQSTFYTQTAFVSTLTSTNQLYLGAYRLGIQSV